MFHSVQNVCIFVTLTSLISASCFILYWQLNWKKKRTQLLSPSQLSAARWALVGRVQRLWLYPIKSCAGLQLKAAKAEQQGLQQLQQGGLRDRSFLIINDSESGAMVTGRMCPQTVLITPRLEQNGDVTLHFPDRAPCTVAAQLLCQPIYKRTSKVWNDSVVGGDCGDGAADWLSDLLKRRVRLIYYDDATTRVPNPDRDEPLPLLKPEQDAALYADLTGFMLLSEPSVTALQRLVQSPLSPLQFRPNILVSSCDATALTPCAEMVPYQEDGWSYIRIGDTAVFRNVKPCTRCIFTCVDPATGQPNPIKEPLNTLKKHRCIRPWKEPLFGINIGLEVPGVINEGDPVYALVE